MTYSFISADQLEDFRYNPAKHLQVRNPLSREQAYLRSNLMPSLVAAAARNAAYGKRFGMWEISRVFTAGSDHAELPDEPERLAVIFRAERDAYREVKRALDALVAEFNLPLGVEPADHPDLYPGRSARVSVVSHQSLVVSAGDGRRATDDGFRALGWIGEVHPELLRRYKLDGAVGYLEIDLQAALEAARPKRFEPIPRFPGIARDLSLLVPVDVTWADVAAALTAGGFENPKFLNDYYGRELPTGKKSLAVRLTFISPERTLTDAEADERAADAFAILKKKFQAELR